MKTLTAFYFTGTGNSRYIAQRLCEKLSSKYQTALYDITSKENWAEEVIQADIILLAFPIYGSAPPIPMRNFVHTHGKYLSRKKILIAETQYFFSGDGAASIGRTVEKYGGIVIGAEQFNMPNNLSDSKVFGIRNGTEIKKTLARAEKRLNVFAKHILSGKVSRRGFRVVPHAVGFFCQRIFWRRGEADKRKQLKVSPTDCIGCGACAQNCPVSNLRIENGKAVAGDKCVLCYRCVNLCPRRAITLLGSSAPEKQYRGPNCET